MKSYIKCVIIAFSVFFSCSCFAAGKDSLVSISRAEYIKGTPFKTNYPSDKNVIKKDRTLSVSPSCPAFKDDTTNVNLYEYSYVGDLDDQFRYKIVKRESYNGEEYYIIDTRKCSTYHLLGKPQLSGTIIVNANESETTDKKRLIEIWTINKKGIKKLATIDLRIKPYASEPIDPFELRISGDRRLMFKDTNGHLWKLGLGTVKYWGMS